MKATSLTFWSGVAAVGVAVAWACRHFGLLDLGSAVLQYLGAVVTLINATAWQAARQFDTVPTKDLTPSGAERLQRIYGHRRRAFRWRWWLAVSLGVLVGLIGTLLKNRAYPGAERWLFYGGFAALFISAALAILIVVENRRLAEMARELPLQLEKERRRRELRQRLRRADLTPSTGPAATGGVSRG